MIVVTAVVAAVVAAGHVAHAGDGRFIRAWGLSPSVAAFCAPGATALAPNEFISASFSGDVVIARFDYAQQSLQVRGWGGMHAGICPSQLAGEDEEDCVPLPGQRVPRSLMQVSMSVTGSHVAAIVDSDNTVRTVTCWGSNLYGACDVPYLYQIIQVSAGYHFNIALQHNGFVQAWGRNDYGQSSPPAGLGSIVEVSAGGLHSLALRSSGTVVGWGAGSGAYDGINHCDQAKPPVGLSSVVKIAAGGWHSVALRADGTVVCWGAGSASPNHDWNMGQSQPPSDLGPCRLIAAGSYSSVAVTMDGRVRRWGWSADGGYCFGHCDVGQESAGTIQQIWAGFAQTIAISDLAQPCCPADIEPNCRVDGDDLAVVLSAWGKVAPGTPGDFDLDGTVDALDLAQVLSDWGPCPE